MGNLIEAEHIKFRGFTDEQVKENLAKWDSLSDRQRAYVWSYYFGPDLGLLGNSTSSYGAQSYADMMAATHNVEEITSIEELFNEKYP